MSDDNVLEFIFRARDEMTDVLAKVKAELAGNSASHADLAQSGKNSSAVLDGLGDAATGAAVAHATAGDSADDHSVAMKANAAAAVENAAAIKGVSEATVEAEGHSRSWIATLLGVESANEGWKMLQGSIAGVSEKVATIRTETVLYLTQALKDTEGGAAALAKVSAAIGEVSTKGQAMSLAKEALVGFGNAGAILPGLSAHLGEVTSKTEESVLAMRLARLAAEQTGESMKEFAAEAGIAGEVLKEFGGSGLLAGLGIAAVTAALGEGIREFAEYQEMASRTSRFAELAGRSGGFEAVHATSLDIADNSTFSSSQLDEAGAAISRFTNLSSTEVSQVMQLSADTAAATGQDISSVAQMLGRAFNEPLKGAMLLNRYTRNIDPGTMAELKQLDAAGNVSGERSLLADKVDAFAGGQAEEQTKTLAGAFSILGDGIEESFGKGLEMVGALVDAFTPLQGVIEGTGRMLEKLGDGFDSVTQHVLDTTGANGPEAKDTEQLNALLSRDNPKGSLGDASSAHFYAQQDAAKIAALESELKAIDPQGAVNAQGQFAPSGSVPVGNINSSTGLYPQQDTRVATQVQEADKVLPEQSKNALLGDQQTGMMGAVKILEDANKYLEQFGPPAKEAAATIATNTENIKLFKEALGVLGTQIADTTSAVQVMVSKLANQAEMAGLIGGAKDVQTTAMQLAPEYLKDNPGFASSSSEKGRNSEQLLEDASKVASVQADAIAHQTDMVNAQLAATATQNNAINPYLAGEKSKDPHTAEIATAIVEGLKEAFKDGGSVSGLNINRKTGAATLRPSASQMDRNALAGYDSAFDQSDYTGGIDADSKGPDAADKKFSDITDITQSATAYNSLLQSGNVTLGQAKEYQDAYTEAQQASADKSISFQAALKQTTALINERNKATAESTQLETDNTNAEAAAANAAMLTGGPQAAALAKAQAKANDTPGLVPGSAAWQASVNGDMTAFSNDATGTANKSIYDLNNQKALLSAPQDKLTQTTMSLSQSNPGVDPTTIDSWAKLKINVDNETAAVAAAKEQHTAWTNIATQGFQSMDSALVDVIMRTKTWGQAFGEVAKQMASQIANLIIQQSLLTPLEGALGLTGSGGSGGSSLAGDAKTAFSFLSSYFADGGVSGPGVVGSVPLKMYAEGGIANSPQMSIFGEAGPEAYVPLADGRSIPVSVKGGGGMGVSAAPVTNHFNVSVNTGAAPSGATDGQHAAMVGSEVSRQLEGMVMKVIQNQQRSGGILN